MAENWRIRFELPDIGCVPAFEDALEPGSISVAMGELNGGPDWEVIAHFPKQPDQSDIETKAAEAAVLCGIDVPFFEISAERDIDWVAEYRQNAKPITAGRFFLYPSHFEGSPPDDAIAIQMDAGAAFGTGDHETTRGCLLALEQLAVEGFTPDCCLDLGCGTGILAIAAALLWPRAQILASDIDPIAIETAELNMVLNDVEHDILPVVGAGWSADEISQHGLYDLVVANILAGPLLEMADETRAGVQKNGRIILSGILVDQADQVSALYQDAGFREISRGNEGDWSTVLMQAVG